MSWQPDVCTCGHVCGDHKSAGPRAFHIGADPTPGVCLVRSCGCRRFERALALIAPAERKQQ